MYIRHQERTKIKQNQGYLMSKLGITKSLSHQEIKALWLIAILLILQMQSSLTNKAANHLSTTTATLLLQGPWLITQLERQETVTQSIWSSLSQVHQTLPLS